MKNKFVILFKSDDSFKGITLNLSIMITQVNYIIYAICAQVCH